NAGETSFTVESVGGPMTSRDLVPCFASLSCATVTTATAGVTVQHRGSKPQMSLDVPVITGAASMFPPVAPAVPPATPPVPAPPSVTVPELPALVPPLAPATPPSVVPGVPPNTEPPAPPSGTTPPVPPAPPTGGRPPAGHMS